MNTITYQFVTDNSVYEVIDHAFSPGVSARNRTRFGRLGGEFQLAGSAHVGLYDGVLVLFVYDRDDAQVLRTSTIHSIVKIIHSDGSDRSNFVPVVRSDWTSIRLVGRPFDRSYTDRRTTSLV